MLPILYSFRRCPYAMRARMALRYSAVECELREVVLKNKPLAMLDASPKGTVPVLVLQDKVIDQSIEIMRWALENQAASDWCAQELDHELVKYNDDEFKFYLDRYKYFDRYPEQSQAWYQAKCYPFLNNLESALSNDNKAKHFLLFPELSAIDVAIFPFVRQFAYVDKAKFDDLALPKLQSWLAFMLESELFQSVMQKYSAWVPEQPEPTLFGTENCSARE